jgi:3-oxoacyl-[acyl-carrier protein] reductase
VSRLAGKTALVTGASRGIGRAIAERLITDGARVLAHYNTGRLQAEALATKIGVELVHADLADPDALSMFASELPRLDILVNNAGIAPQTRFETQDVDSFDRLFAVNVRAPFFLTQSVAQRMPTGGRVIFIGSVVSSRVLSMGDVVAYPASKGAVDAMARMLAQHLGARGITVNVVAPGVIDVERHEWLRTEGMATMVKGWQALKRIGRPDDIADVVAFLASDDARWITGQVLAVGGGTRL